MRRTFPASLLRCALYRRVVPLYRPVHLARAPRSRTADSSRAPGTAGSFYRRETKPAPAEPAPAEPTPAELTPTELTSAEPTPAEPTPAEPTPAELTPDEPTPAEPTLAKPTPAPVELDFGVSTQALDSLLW